MVYFDIVITSENRLKGEKKAYLFDDVVRLQFKNEDEYFKFIDNPTLSIDDFNIVKGITDINFLEKIINLSNLSQKIKESTVMVELFNIKDLPIKLLQTKKKIKLNLIALDYKDTVNLLKSPYMHENVFFYDKFNEGMMLSLKDMINVYDELLRYAKIPLENNYSPAESFYYIYNLLKQRIYTEEGKDEKETKSRGLKEVLYGDKIVCVGYSNLFAAISSVLGLCAEVCSWEHIKEDEGHASNVIYLNDPKYNICGIYGVDVTWDSKENEKDTEFENNIENFLLPMPLEEKVKKSIDYKPTLGCSYYRFFISKINYIKYPFIPNNKKLAYKKANIIYKNLGLPQVTENTSLDDIEKDLLNLGNKPIPTNTLKNIIMNVTPKSAEDLEKTIKSSRYYIIETKRKEILLQRIFGNKRS